MTNQCSLPLPCTNKSQIDGDDYLSNLHESIISHILSRLPTKDGVQTSILSKSWKYKWRYMRHVEITDRAPRAREINKECFANFVDIILSLARNLTNVILICDRIYDPSRVKTWIYGIFRHRDITTLELSCWSTFGKKGIVLPWALLDKSSLKHLKLVFPGCTLKIESQNSFLNLTSFHLNQIHILNGNSNIDTLVLHFPVLEILEVIRCKWEDVKFVKIYAPLLNTFITQTEYSKGPNSYYSIEIIGSMVSTLKCDGGFPDNVILTGSQITSASYHNECCLTNNVSDRSLRKVIGLQVRNILNESSRLNDLTLSEFVLHALRSVSHLNHHDELKRLILWAPAYPKQLFDLLHVAPSLKYLWVNVFKWKRFNYDGIKLLPSCIVSSLEEVVLDGFYGKKYQYTLARCLLKNGRALKKISMDGPEPKEQDAIVKRLSMFPRISTRLTIVFLSVGEDPVTFVVDEID